MSSGFQSEFRAAVEEPLNELKNTANTLRDSADFTKLQTGERAEKPKSAEMVAAADPSDVPVDDLPFGPDSSDPEQSLDESDESSATQGMAQTSRTHSSATQGMAQTSRPHPFPCRRHRSRHHPSRSRRRRCSAHHRLRPPNRPAQRATSRSPTKSVPMWRRSTQAQPSPISAPPVRHPTPTTRRRHHGPSRFRRRRCSALHRDHQLRLPSRSTTPWRTSPTPTLELTGPPMPMASTQLNRRGRPSGEPVLVQTEQAGRDRTVR